MNLLLRHMFFGIIGSIKLIHLDLMYMNRMISPDEYQKDAEGTSQSINDCVKAVSRGITDDRD